MKFRMVFTVLLALFSSAIVPGLASVNTQTSPEIPIEEVIRRFAAAESENKRARVNYSFKQDIDLLTFGDAGSISGRFKRVSEIILDDMGNRIERITYFPPSTAAVIVSKEDYQDMAGVQPFALSTEDLPKYDVKYHGKEKVDELNTYVFDVQPKRIVKGERYFQGRIWVDDLDLQIVKVAGQAVPLVDDQQFPHFETYRENIDGRYWFPTYTYADDVLEFKKGPSVRIKMTIRYMDYKRFAGTIRVIDDDESGPEETEKKPEGDNKAGATKKPATTPRKPPEEPDRRH
jgi:hypothetical protein